MTKTTLTVPGNLLLFGEYAVLEQGGLGLACAVAPHVVTRLEPSSRFCVEGQLGARAISWRPGDDGDDRELLHKVGQFLVEQLAARGVDLPAFENRVVIDSSAFVGASGNKRGFGSSAAATVALCNTACELAGIEDEETRFELAVGAHRYAQGGRGSGYDVATSFFGGIGLFRGGERPEYERVQLDWLPELSLLEMGTPASTAHALYRYAAWKAGHTDEAVRFLQHSNSLISALVRSSSWEEAKPYVRELSALGRRLGRQIDIPAEPSDAYETEGGDESGLCKAVGAGAELFLCLAGETSQADTIPVDIDWEGCTWR